jgi:CheY-like chemotaxis protein
MGLQVYHRFRPFSILLIEDKPADAHLFTEALDQHASVPFRLHVAIDGVDGLNRIRSYGPRDSIDLILLDWNLPGSLGREVLRTLKQDPVSRSTPVIVFASSGTDSDVNAAYDLHANCYVHKPADLQEFSRLIEVVERFWMTTVQLPY